MRIFDKTTKTLVIFADDAELTTEIDDKILAEVRSFVRVS